MNKSELEYEFSEIKTVKQLRKIVLDEIIELISIWKEEFSSEEKKST